MTVSSPEQTLVNNLITLKTQYEQALTEADTISAHYREQLSHVNALLLNQIGSANGLAPFQTHIKSAEPILDAIAALQESTDINRLTLAPAKTVVEASPTPPEVAPKPKQAKAQPSPAVGGRTPRELLPIHQGLKRLDAIAKVFQNHQGQEVTIDTLTEQLFGNLSTEAHKAERLKLRTLLYQGEQRGLWTKGDAASTYVIKASGQATAKTVAQPKAKAKATAKAAAPRAQAKAPKASPVTATTKKRISLPLLSSFDGMTKLESIASVLEKNRGEILHHDTIIQSLYGDLNLEELKAERVRIKTALLGGVKNKKWQKASVASSYFLPEASAGAKSKASGRKPKASKAPNPKSKPVTEAAAEVVSETPSDLSSKKGRNPAPAKTPVKSKFKRTRSTATQLNPEGA
jgi:hypothetical protein